MSSAGPKKPKAVAPVVVPVHEAALALPCVEDTFEFAGTRLLLKRPREPGILLDFEEVHQAYEKDEYMPYWASLWPVAKYLSRHILTECRVAPASGKRALDLGCGLGLPGLAALSAGYDVTFSDYDETALWFAAENARKNGFADFRTTAIDFRAPPDETFDLIIASDLIYEARHCEPLAQAFKVLLADGGMALAGDQNRPYAPEFKAALAAAGLAFRELAVGPDPAIDPDIAGTIYVVTR